MKVTVLGTGTSQGVPVIGCHCSVCRSTNPKDNRLRCSVLVEEGNSTVVVDVGPDFRHQMLKHRVARLDAALLTHEHADHIFGLDDIRSYNWISQKPLDIYCEERVQDNLKSIFRYVFAANKYPGTPQMDLRTIDGAPFQIGDIAVIPIRLMHYRLPVYGFRFGSFAYLTDFKTIAAEELEKLMGIDTLVISALRYEPHISHLNLEEALALIEKIGPRQSYLTHMSHDIGLHDTLSSRLPQSIQPAYDGLTIHL